MPTDHELNNPAEVEQEDLSGKIIRGYELKHQFNAGGFGVIYNAFQYIVEREVAIKIIRSQYANQPDFIRRFEVEARIVARLEHINVVPIYDFWRDPTGAYLVMRWLRGGSLRETLDTHGVWTLTDVRHFVEQIGSALAAAHAQNIIHRDIKPENILLDDIQNAYLSDFGIALDLSRYTAETIGNLSFGSVDYMAPEQLSGQMVTPMADIYSLGVVIYELLTGHKPFTAASATARLRQLASEPVPSLAKYRPDLPPELDTVIWRATAKNPSARFNDAFDLIQTFRAAADRAKNPLFVPQEKGGTVSESVETGTRPLSRATEIYDDDTRNVGSRPVSIPAAQPKRVKTVRVSPLPDEQLSSVYNPYKGLRPFEEADSSDFYGREELVAHLLERLSDSSQRFLAIIGPSGSGKSSLIKAGVIPALRRGVVPGSERWYIASMVPGTDPFRDLTEALLQVAIDAPDNIENLLRGAGSVRHIRAILPDEDDELLLFIDQFEEVFTLVENEAERTAFLDTLQRMVAAPATKLRIIVTLRADFYDRPLFYSQFGKLMQQYTETLLPLSREDLRDTILKPAHKAGLIIEDHLAERIVEAVYARPGALPLMQYALTELYERRHHNLLTVEAYDEIGGVTGALARRADQIFETFTEEQDREWTRQLFLRLITIEGQERITRQRVMWADVLASVNNRAQMQAIIERFSQYRLLTLDRDPETRAPTVEIAHEALIDTWPQLKLWISHSRANLLRRQQLDIATNDWQESGRDASFLARGTRLLEFEALTESGLNLSPPQIQFIRASVGQRERAARRTRLVIAGLVIFSMVTLILALFAFDRQYQAEIAQADAITQRDRANSVANTARSRELAASALAGINQTDLSLLLSTAAVQIDNTYEARNSLLTGLQANPFLSSYLYGHSDWVRAVQYSPDGTMLVSAGRDGQIIRWDTQTRRPIGAPLFRHTGAVNDISIRPDSAVIASVGADLSVRLWDAANGEIVWEALTEHTAPVWSVAYSPDSALLATGDEAGTIILWNAVTGDVIQRIDNAHDDAVYDLAYSPDGRLLASASGDFTVQLWDANTGTRASEALIGHENWVLTLAFSPNGQLLASSGEDGTVIFWDVAAQTSVTRFNSSSSDGIRGIAFDNAGQILATASLDGTLGLWNVAQQRLLVQPFVGHGAAVWGVDFHPDALQMASGAADGRVLIWDFALPQRPGESAFQAGHVVLDSEMSPDGSQLVTVGGANNDSGVGVIWNTADYTRIATLNGHQGIVTSAAYNADGTLLATTSTDQTIILWDMATRQPLYPPLSGHGTIVWDVAFSPDGARLYSIDDVGVLVQWDVATGEPIGDAIVTGDTGALTLAVDPIGQHLAVGSRDGTIIIFDLPSLQSRYRITGAHTSTITRLLFNNDGAILISASRDTQIGLWDVATGERRQQPLTGHTDWVLDVTLSADGRWLASASRDRTVRLWDFETGRPVGLAMTGHSDWVNTVAFNPSGTRLYSGGNDANVIVWNVSLEDWLAAACAIANREFTADEWAQYFPDEAQYPICE